VGLPVADIEALNYVMPLSVAQVLTPAVEVTGVDDIGPPTGPVLLSLQTIVGLSEEVRDLKPYRWIG
jgi:hypothetical protein